MSRPVLHNKRAAFVASSIDSKLWIPFSKQEKLFFHNCCSAVDTVLLTSPKKKENNCVSGYHRKPTSMSWWEECGSDRMSRVAPAATWINCSTLFSSHLLYSLTPVIFSHTCYILSHLLYSLTPVIFSSHLCSHPETHAELLNTNAVHLRSSVAVAQLPSCVLLFCDAMDYRPPDCSVHGISQARILEWAAILYSRESSQPRDWARVSCIGRQVL